MSSVDKCSQMMYNGTVEVKVSQVWTNMEVGRMAVNQKPMHVGWSIVCPKCKSQSMVDDITKINNVKGHLQCNGMSIIVRMYECPVCGNHIALDLTSEMAMQLEAAAAGILEQLFQPEQPLQIRERSTHLIDQYQQLNDRIDREYRIIAKAKQGGGIVLDDCGGAVVLETIQPTVCVY